MSAFWLRAGAIVVATGLTSAVGAQVPPASPGETLSSPRQEMEADKAMERPSGKAGKEEPSAHAPTVPPNDTTVLRNGALAVPGAPTETDTVPAKFSAQNNADDRLSTLAYTFKTLPNDQRQVIFQTLRDQPAATHAPRSDAQIGEVLPFAVRTAAIPATLAERVPAARGFHYVVVDNRVLLVAPASRAIVGVFTGTGDAPIETGHDRLR